MEVSVDTLAQVETLLAQNVDLLLHIYTAQLFVIGITGACLVIFLLYKFLRKFY